jgi:hypothetical protein
MEKWFELWRTTTPSKTFECGSLLPLLRGNPVLTSRTSGGSAQGRKSGGEPPHSKLNQPEG